MLIQADRFTVKLEPLDKLHSSYICASTSPLLYIAVRTGDIGLRGLVGEAGIPGTKGDKGNLG